MDFFKKISHVQYRVEKSDSTDADEQSALQEEPDVFSRTDWHIVFETPQKNLKIPVHEIQSLLLVNLNLKTNPSLVTLEIIYKNKNELRGFLALPRDKAKQLRRFKKGDSVSVSFFSKDGFLNVVEVTTETTNVYRELTQSRTLKLKYYQNKWLYRLGIKDPVLQKWRPEALWLALVIFLVIFVLVFLVFLGGADI